MKKGNIIARAIPAVVGNYARKFGVQVRMQGMKAYTNGSVITIPRLDLDDPVTARMAYGYLAHEAGHVRYTSFRSLARQRSDFLMRTMVNIIEDARIERLIGKEYVGVWENLELLRFNEDSWDRYAGLIKTMPELQLLLGGLCCYLASYVQRFERQRPRAAQVIRELRNRFPDLARRRLVLKFYRQSLRVLKARNTSDVIRISRALVGILEELFGKRPEVADPCADVQEPGQTKKKRSGRSKKKSNAASESEGNTDSPGGGGAADEDAESKIMTPLQQAVNDLHDQCGGEAGNMIPGTDFTARINSMFSEDTGSRDDFGTMVLGAARPGRADFAKELDRGEMHRTVTVLRHKILAFVNSARDSTADHGRHLDIPRAQFVRCGETRIFRPRAYERDPSTDVSVLVDCSGSMMAHDGAENSRLETACRAALNVAAAFDGVPEVKLQVLAFPGWNCEVELLKDFHQSTRRQAPYFDQQPRGSTPLAQALYMAAGRMTAAERHVVMLITDGIPDSVNLTMKAIRCLTDAGVDLMGIGIKMDFVTHLIPNSIVIQGNSMRGLSDVLARLLGDYFTRRTKELELAA